ncbi:MAG: cytochrome bd-I oxidase subunit CydH [Ewingella sp.]|nr:YnhF family membrane protein [Pseudomonas reactans]
MNRPARSVVTANFLLYRGKGEVKSLVKAGNDHEILAGNCEKLLWHTNCMAYGVAAFDPQGVFMDSNLKFALITTVGALAMILAFSFTAVMH